MKKRWLLLCLIQLALVINVTAQIVTPPRGRQIDAQQKEQLRIDEQLASQAFRDQEYDKARDLYKSLLDRAGQPYHFQQYVECLIQLKDYDRAEKELKDYLKKDPYSHRSIADLVYVYKQLGKKDKAKRQFDDVVENLPPNAATIRSISYSFQSRGLYDMALEILEKGNQLLDGRETLYMDMATIYQSSANYQEAFRNYFRELEAHPGQYNNIQNRLQTLLFYDVNNSITDELRIALLQQTQEKPDNLEYARLLVWFALQQEDYDIALAQCQSIDLRTHDQDGQINNLAGICLNNKQYDVAREGYRYLVSKGKSGPFYGQAVAGIIKTDYQQLIANNSNDGRAFSRLLERIDEAYRDVTSADISKLLLIQADIVAYHLDQADEAIQLLSDNINNIPTKQGQAELKLKLADIYLHKDEVWEATLLYSQVDKSLKEEPLGHEARFKNAQLRYFIGEYEWAQSQLKVLKAATSKLIANDAMTLSLIIKDNLEADTTGVQLNRLAQVDYRIYQHREDEAIVMLDAIIATGNEVSKPHALFRKAEIAEQRKEYETAEQLYLQIVEQFPYSYMADAALMRAALIEQNELNNKELAKQHYEQLIDNYTTSIYTAQAKKNYRKL